MRHHFTREWCLYIYKLINLKILNMKKYLLLFAVMLFATTGFAQSASVLNRIDSEEDLAKKSLEHKERIQHKRFCDIEQYRDSEVVTTTILSEDFSKFTAGSEENPDATQLENPETSKIDDAYFNTPGWEGLEVYQAGGKAYLAFSETYQETGMLITPFINTTGTFTVKCRVKSLSAQGDYFCYNLADKNSQALDFNYSFIPSGEWVDVEFVSTYGQADTYIVIFAYSDGLLVDNLEVTKYDIPAPTLLPETDVTTSSFIANWEPVTGVDEYYFYLYAKHTAQIEETYFFTDLNFNDIESYGTPESPEVTDALSLEYSAWYAFLPLFINGSIGVSGEYSSMDYYGYFASPEYDLSSNNGVFNISFSLKGNTGEKVDVILHTSVEEGADSESITIQSDEWTEYSFTMTNGDVRSMIEIVYYGADALFLDNLKVYQDLATGDRITTPIIQTLCSGPNFGVTVHEHYRMDELYYQLYSVKYLYTYDNTYGDYIVSAAMNSELTEPRYVTLATEDVKDIKTQSPAFAYFNEGQLNIFNPENEMVSVYNINGACVYTSTTNGTVSLNLAQGVYIVNVGNKAMKVVND